MAEQQTTTPTSEADLNPWADMAEAYVQAGLDHQRGAVDQQIAQERDHEDRRLQRERAAADLARIEQRLSEDAARSEERLNEDAARVESQREALEARRRSPEVQAMNDAAAARMQSRHGVWRSLNGQRNAEAKSYKQEIDDLISGDDLEPVQAELILTLRAEREAVDAKRRKVIFARNAERLGPDATKADIESGIKEDLEKFHENKGEYEGLDKFILRERGIYTREEYDAFRQTDEFTRLVRSYREQQRAERAEAAAAQSRAEVEEALSQREARRTAAREARTPTDNAETDIEEPNGNPQENQQPPTEPENAPESDDKPEEQEPLYGTPPEPENEPSDGIQDEVNNVATDIEEPNGNPQENQQPPTEPEQGGNNNTPEQRQEDRETRRQRLVAAVTRVLARNRGGGTVGGGNANPTPPQTPPTPTPPAGTPTGQLSNRNVTWHPSRQDERERGRWLPIELRTERMTMRQLDELHKRREFASSTGESDSKAEAPVTTELPQQSAIAAEAEARDDTTTSRVRRRLGGLTLRRLTRHGRGDNVDQEPEVQPTLLPAATPLPPVRQNGEPAAINIAELREMLNRQEPKNGTVSSNGRPVANGRQ